jgi:hypothetical protein
VVGKHVNGIEKPEKKNKIGEWFLIGKRIKVGKKKKKERKKNYVIAAGGNWGGRRI